MMMSLMRPWWWWWVLEIEVAGSDWRMGNHTWEMGYRTCERGRNVGLGLIGVEAGKKGQGMAVLLAADGVGLIGEY